MNNMAEYVEQLLLKLKEKEEEITQLKEKCNCHSNYREEKPTELLEETIKLSSKYFEIERKEFSDLSIEQEILKDITNGGKSQFNTKANLTNSDMSLFKDNEEGEYKQKMKEFMKKCPYIDKLKQDSEKYKATVAMLQTLAKYNDYMKKLFETNKDLKGNGNEEKHKAFMHKNRELRIEIKSMLCEERENVRRIDEFKRSMNSFGMTPKVVQAVEQEGDCKKGKPGNNTKRDLIRFRDYLLEENEKLLFTMNKKLL